MQTNKQLTKLFWLFAHKIEILSMFLYTLLSLTFPLSYNYFMLNAVTCFKCLDWVENQACSLLQYNNVMANLFTTK